MGTHPTILQRDEADVTHWDVFHSDRLELTRSLTLEEVRAAMARGEIVEDDLIRPAASGAPWTRLGDMPALLEPGPAARTETKADTEPTSRIADDVEDEDEDQEPEFLITDDDDEDDVYLERSGNPMLDEAEHTFLPSEPRPDGGGAGEPYSAFDLNLRNLETAGAGTGADERAPSSVEVEAIATSAFDDDEEEYDPLEEDEAVAEFTLSRGAAERVEELDLAAMVDVAFQLVLFFLVTATTVLYKTLEVPKPNPEAAAPAAAAQARSKTLDDLADDFILVEIDPLGVLKVDHDPVPAEMNALTERLRAERERTHRNSMLLSADLATPHRNAVLAYDAANEVGLGIAIARPAPASPSP